jgi:hypothetical protein
LTGFVDKRFFSVFLHVDDWTCSDITFTTTQRVLAGTIVEAWLLTKNKMMSLSWPLLTHVCSPVKQGNNRMCYWQVFWHVVRSDSQKRKIQRDFMSPLRYTNSEQDLHDNRETCETAPEKFSNGSAILCRREQLTCDDWVVSALKIIISKSMLCLSWYLVTAYVFIAGIAIVIPVTLIMRGFISLAYKVKKRNTNYKQYVFFFKAVSHWYWFAAKSRRIGFVVELVVNFSQRTLLSF